VLSFVLRSVAEECLGPVKVL